MDDRAAATAEAIGANTGDDDAHLLFSWARQHGAKISESIEIKETAYGGRGMFAKRDIPEHTELITIPYHLQLGVRQLAEGTDEEMQKMAKSLDPWQIKRNEVFFTPLSIALVAEKRKGPTSIFAPWLQTLPKSCPNAIGAGDDDNDLSDLLHWAPNVADMVRRRRLGLNSVHEGIAPPSLSIEELRWAATNVCSRSLLRKRIKELTSEEVERIGEFSASDHSRMLPVIDLVNHGSLESANVWVGHLSQGDTNVNDFSTSLKSTRDIKEGEELLFDYGGGGGGGEKISNDRLLLDYGFVLPEHTDRVTITLEELDTAISAIDKDRAGMNAVPKEDIEGLHALITFLIKQASEVQAGAPLLFASGEPSMQTLAVTVAMTCRDYDDVTRVLKPIREITSPQHDASLLPSQIVKSCTEIQMEFARYTLKLAASLALSQRPSVTEDSKENCSVEGREESSSSSSFANVAREYSKLCQQMLQEVADMSR